MTLTHFYYHNQQHLPTSLLCKKLFRPGRVRMGKKGVQSRGALSTCNVIESEPPIIRFNDGVPYRGVPNTPTHTQLVAGANCALALRIGANVARRRTASRTVADVDAGSMSVAARAAQRVELHRRLEDVDRRESRTVRIATATVRNVSEKSAVKAPTGVNCAGLCAPMRPKTVSCLPSGHSSRPIRIIGRARPDVDVHRVVDFLHVLV